MYTLRNKYSCVVILLIPFLYYHLRVSVSRERRTKDMFLVLFLFLGIISTVPIPLTNVRIHATVPIDAPFLTLPPSDAPPPFTLPPPTRFIPPPTSTDAPTDKPFCASCTSQIGEQCEPFDCYCCTSSCYPNASCEFSFDTGNLICQGINVCTDVPTEAPTDTPTEAPTTAMPTITPTDAPTMAEPTEAPTNVPTTATPTNTPIEVPTTAEPTGAPSVAPTNAPTNAPTSLPTEAPTETPTNAPTDAPSNAPTTASPTNAPTETPTNAPTTATPTGAPSVAPTNTPTTASPTNAPTEAPTMATPTGVPSVAPTNALTTAEPTSAPTNAPTTAMPTITPTDAPTEAPTTGAPTIPPITGAPTDCVCDVKYGQECFDDCRCCDPCYVNMVCNDPLGYGGTCNGTALLCNSPGDNCPTIPMCTQAPTPALTESPTIVPTTGSPTRAPTTGSPTRAPTTGSPTRAPTTGSPTRAPTTGSPTRAPTTGSPTMVPFHCNFCTFSQGGYGRPCRSLSGVSLSSSCAQQVEECYRRKVEAACIRNACFVSPVILGNASLPGGHTVTFTTSYAIEGYLPASGTPAVFVDSSVNPSNTSAGVFGGQLLTAVLNQLFMSSDTSDLSTLRFSSACDPVNPIIIGLTVAEVIYIANQVISGSSSPLYNAFTPAILNTALAIYNEGFEHCKNVSSVPCFDCDNDLMLVVGDLNLASPVTPSTEIVYPGLFIGIIVFIAFIVVLIIAIQVCLWYFRRNKVTKQARFRRM